MAGVISQGPVGYRPAGRSYLHPVVRMVSDPWIASPCVVWPVREADVSLHCIPVSWILKENRKSGRLSVLTSFTETPMGAASSPVSPKRMVLAFTVVASNVSVVRMATEIFPLPLRLMLFGNSPGLMSIFTATGTSGQTMPPNEHTFPAPSEARTPNHVCQSEPTNPANTNNPLGLRSGKTPKFAPGSGAATKSVPSLSETRERICVC